MLPVIRAIRSYMNSWLGHHCNLKILKCDLKTLPCLYTGKWDDCSINPPGYTLREPRPQTPVVSVHRGQWAQKAASRPPTTPGRTQRAQAVDPMHKRYLESHISSHFPLPFSLVFFLWKEFFRNVLTLQQIPIRQSDSQQGVVVFSPLSLLLSLPHGLRAQHCVLLHQITPGKQAQVTECLLFNMMVDKHLQHRLGSWVRSCKPGLKCERPKDLRWVHTKSNPCDESWDGCEATMQRRH